MKNLDSIRKFIPDFDLFYADELLRFELIKQENESLLVLQFSYKEMFIIELRLIGVMLLLLTRVECGRIDFDEPTIVNIESEQHEGVAWRLACEGRGITCECRDILFTELSKKKSGEKLWKNCD